MTLAEAWTPGRDYKRGQRVRWKQYLLECQWDHQAAATAKDPWAPTDEQAHTAAIRRWHVCFQEMRDELPPRRREASA